jgi:hypothetical protein
MYRYIRDEQGNNMENIIQRIKDNASIPFDPSNADYQKYLKWLAEGNTPEAAS